MGYLQDLTSPKRTRSQRLFWDFSNGYTTKTILLLINRNWRQRKQNIGWLKRGKIQLQTGEIKTSLDGKV